ncbi:hypothetical protein [Echinicola salinicaeni]|uniref:hypothetical protein n=1 Tax=Echinicola salinicaeni TaxID=2762757 RepID=UPI001644E2B9|nr:hypothetical protein [Echinicola salinicaeni]
MNRREKHLEIIKKAVIAEFNNGNPKNWQNKDFESLSFKIKIETKILISKSTLKRIFGKNKTGEAYYPQPATLEALQEFGKVKDPESILIQQKQKFQKRSLLALLGIALISISLLLLAINQSETTESIHAELKLERVEGSSPSTAFFSYSIPETKDSLFLYLGNKMEPFYLSPYNNKISVYLRFPGVFHPFIASRNKKVLASTEGLFVQSKGWQALGYYYEQPYSMRYYPIPMNYNSPDYAFHINGSDLHRLGMDTSKIIVLRLDNFKKTDVNGDDFILNTKVKSAEFWPAIRCNSIYISVEGENSKISFKTTHTGCSAFSEYILSEKFGTGSDQLVNFSIDTREWHMVEIKNVNKKVEVKINNQLAFSDNYSKSLGKIHGVSVMFHGNGYLDHLQLVDNESNPVFSLQ